MNNKKPPEGRKKAPSRGSCHGVTEGVNKIPPSLSFENAGSHKKEANNGYLINI